MSSTDRQKADSGGPVGYRLPPVFHRVLPASPLAVRDTLCDVRARFARLAPPDTLGRLELVMAEVLNNVVQHAARQSCEHPAKKPLSIHLSILCTRHGFACAVTDDGESMPNGCLVPHDLPDSGDSDLPEGGFGWFMIQSLTQTLHYHRADDRNCLAFSIASAQPA